MSRMLKQFFNITTEIVNLKAWEEYRPDDFYARLSKEKVAKG